MKNQKLPIIDNNDYILPNFGDIKNLEEQILSKEIETPEDDLDENKKIIIRKIKKDLTDEDIDDIVKDKKRVYLKKSPKNKKDIDKE